MNSKRIIIYSLVSIITSLLVIWSFTTGTKYEEPGYIYQVYLDGEKIGLIDSEEKLYKLINLILFFDCNLFFVNKFI